MGGVVPETGARPTATLVVSGPVTLVESPRWREALLAALTEGKNVRIDLATAGPWDLSVLQLLLAVLASARKGGQAIRLVHVPNVLREIAEQAGVDDQLAGAIDGRLD